VVFVSTIGFVTVQLQLNGRKRDPTVRTVTNPMVETETTPYEQLQLNGRTHWGCNCSYGVVSVSTIGIVTVLTVWSLFLPLSCNCSYGVVSVSTIGLVTITQTTR
jgi:dolichyl-phosphate-mannose--protein O-mannosyl transferase